MPVETHVEPFIHLVDVTSDTVLIAWGAFWFQRRTPLEQWRLVETERMEEVAGRTSLIGHEAEPYGDALVEVLDDDGAVVAAAGTAERSWVQVEGLRPDTPYRYRVLLDGEEWAAGERWDWAPAPRGGYDLAPAGRSYDLRFRTWPPPDAAAPLSFAVLGDYGVGTASDSESSRRQRRVAAAIEAMVVDHDARLIVTTGDNVYDGERGGTGSGTGAADHDWWSSFYSPYRYVISRVPVYPSVGNHDASGSDTSDDRGQMYDNFHTGVRFAGGDQPSSVGPGLNYRVGWGADIELVAVDSSTAPATLGVNRFFEDPEHLRWLHGTFGRPGPRWRIPFSHHPAYCAGPHHGNDDEILATLVPLYRDSGVRLVLAGHEHNFQISEADGVLHVLTGAGGNLREELPENLVPARTVAWAVQGHALLIRIAGDELQLTPVSGVLPDGSLELMLGCGPWDSVVVPPITVRLDGPARDGTGRVLRGAQ